MIDLDEWRGLLTEESDRVEFTASTKNTDTFSEAVTAFANDLPNHRQPGYLVIGANDDGTPSGLTVTDELLTTNARSVSDARAAHARSTRSHAGAQPSAISSSICLKWVTFRRPWQRRFWRRTFALPSSNSRRCVSTT